MIYPLMLNLLCSVLAGLGARQWSATSDIGWLFAAVACNCVGFVGLAWVIKAQGLGAGTAIALAATMALNAVAGLVLFGEQMTAVKGAGLAMTLIAIALMTWRTA